MRLFEVDWTRVPEWISAATGLGTLIVAIWAAMSWREQLRGGSKHLVAQEVATAARLLRYAFYSARSPMIEGWEFPEVYWQAGPGRTRTNSETADAYLHVYNRRMNELWPNIKAVADLRAKAGAVLGEGTATDLEDLAKKARELQFYFSQHVDQKRTGSDGVKLWADQDYVERVEKSVVAHDPFEDRFSREFEEILERTLVRVRIHL
jgi:hypothetical protein